MPYENVWSAGDKSQRPPIVEIGEKFVLIPTTAPDGTVLTDEQALAVFDRTQRLLGVFDSAQSANHAAGVLQGLASRNR